MTVRRDNIRREAAQFLVCAIVIASVHLCNAQTTDSTFNHFRTSNTLIVFPPDTSLRTAFYGMNRTVDAYSWDINSALEGNTNELRYAFEEQMNSTLIPFTNAVSPQQQTVNSRLILSAPIFGALSWESYTAASAIANNQDIGVNNISRIGTMAGITGIYAGLLRMAILGGAISDAQIGMHDAGGQYLIETQLAPVASSGYEFSGFAMSNQEYISPRRNQTDSAEINAVYLSPEAVMHGYAGAEHSERDFYFADSVSAPYTGEAFNIERRTENDEDGGLSLNYNINNDFHVGFDGGTGQKTITLHDAYKTSALPDAHIDTRISQFSANASGLFNATVFGAVINGKMHIEEFDENHDVIPAPENSPEALASAAEVESQKNSNSVRTTLSGDCAIPLGADSLHISGTYGVLHYNTPDTNNHDDRDELDAAIHGAYAVRVAPLWTWGAYADIFFHHLVYLLSEESGNNAWNRIFRIAPYVDITPTSAVASHASFEALANYTVFDFTPLLGSSQSYSFRQLQLRDSTVVDLSPILQASGYVSLRWYEHGSLDWGSFSERPIDRNQEWAYGGAIREKLSMTLFVSAGVQIFSRFTSQYAGGGAYIPFATLKTLGPDADLMWNVSKWGDLHISGWYEFVLNDGLPTQIVPNFLMTIAWKL